jgi:two-component system sensor histidine kinase KdpD
MADVRPVLVALGSEARSLRLIQAALRLARELDAPWIAVHVDVGSGELAEDHEQVQVWAQEAQRLGARILWTRASTLAQGLADAARSTRAQALVLGRSRRRWPWARLGHSTADELQRRGLDARLVTLEDRPEDSSGEGRLRAGAAIGALSVVAACTGLAWVVPRGQDLPLVLPIYLLGVAFIAHRWGQGLGALSTLLSLLLYDFLEQTPRFRLVAEGWPNLLFFLTMLMAAQLVMGLFRQLRQQAAEVQRREVHTASLYLLGRALAQDRTPDAVARTAAEHLRRVFKVRAWLLFPEGDGWRALPEALEDGEVPAPEQLLSSLDVGARLGDPLEPLAVGAGYCLSLSGTDRSEGVLRVKPLTPAGLPWETWELLKAFAVQIALALERIRWLEAARKAELEAETERLRNTFLGAISHDLRTPLAAIQGAASSLLLPGSLPEETRRDLLTMIQDESERLAHLLGNILDLTRLESGALHVQKEWQPLEEVVGSALGRFERHGGQMPVRVDLPPDLPLVPLDAALMEQALLNLLTNAQRHAPSSATDLRAWAEPERVWLEVADRGPGIPEAYQERIFDKFFRLPGAAQGGVGLGLAICKAIVQAHGGSILADARAGGGTAIRLFLPLPGPPPLPPGEPA